MASPENEEWRNWADLPREVTASILSKLPAVDTLTSAQFVCKWWLEVSKDPSIWKIIDMHNSHESGVYYDKLFRNAVNRSCGQVVEIIIEDFADDELLEYIANRCRQIKCLRLIDCSLFDLSDWSLIETVGKLPALEELELTLGYWDDPDKTIESIGSKCPSLKAFKMNAEYFLDFDAICDFEDEESFNTEAFAIGKSMPGLKSLQIIRNSLTNKGLAAILDGCPELESLDLRKCLNVCLKGKVWERCVKHVEQLRLPSDSTEDYPYRTSPERRAGRFNSDYDSDDYDYEDYSNYLDYPQHYGDHYDEDPLDYEDFTDPFHPDYW